MGIHSKDSAVSLRRQLRTLVAGPSFDMADTLPRHSQPEEMRAVSMVSQLDDLLKRVVTCANIIEAPTKKALNQAISAANTLGDTQMVEKAKGKFQRIFGEIFKSTATIREQILPLIQLTTAIGDGKKKMDPTVAKQLAMAMKEALPIVRNEFRALDPQAHESAVEMEIQKQGHFLKQIKTFIAQHGNSNPEAAQKLVTAAHEAEIYIENLKNLADPEYADRVQQNIKRAVVEYLPAALKATAVLLKEFGAAQKAASVSKHQKRLKTVAKRIVLLSYLRSKSL